MGYTAPPTGFVTGGTVLAPDWRTFADDVRFLAAEKPVARAYRGSAFTPATGAFTTVPFNYVNYDSHGGFDPAGTGVYTVPITGYYRASAAIRVNSTASGQRLLLILIGPGGGQVARGKDSVSHASATLGIASIVTGDYFYSAGDTIQAQYYMDVSLAVVFDPAFVYMSITYLRP